MRFSPKAWVAIAAVALLAVLYVGVLVLADRQLTRMLPGAVADGVETTGRSERDRRTTYAVRRSQATSCSSVWAPDDGDVVVCQPQPAVICDLLRICCAGPLGPSILPLVPHLDRGYRGSVAKIIAGSDFNPDGTSLSVLMRAVNHI